VHHHLRSRVAAGWLAAVVAGVIAALAVPAPSLAAIRAPARAAAVPAAAAGSAGTAARPVLLLDGERLLARQLPGGGAALASLPDARRFPGLFGFNICNTEMAMPADALPFLGHGLDPSLFDVSALQRLERGGRLPVQVSYRGQVPSLPGVRITHAAGRTAQGYLTALSAVTFGRALSHQFDADHALGSYGTDGMFRGMDISLAGAGTGIRAAPPRPDLPMRTLTVRGSNLAGRPDTGDEVLVVNAADCNRFSELLESVNVFFHGEARFSVPAGNYWAAGEFFATSGKFPTLHLTFLPQFSVQRNQTVHVAAQAARSRITMVTPRPAVPQQAAFTLIRGGRSGTLSSIEWIGAFGTLFVNKTSAVPTVGTLATFTSAELTSPARAAGTPYAYSLDFAGPGGIIPRQRYVATSASLATVHERYYQDVRTDGAFSTTGGFALQAAASIVFSDILPLRMPGLQTQYFSAAPSLIWSGTGYEFGGSPSQFPSIMNTSAYGQLQAARQTTEDWNRYPLHPQPQAVLPGTAAAPVPVFPAASRSGDALRLDPTAFSDNSRGHIGDGFAGAPATRDAGSYEIDQNGRRVASGSAAGGIPPVRLGRQSRVIRFTLNAARTGRSFVLSTGSRTVWTWRSVHAAGMRLPDPWFCAIGFDGVTITVVKRCAVQPVMTLSYRVQGLALNGSTSSGPQVIGLTAGHIQLGTAPRVTGATAQVSYDNGRTWQPAVTTPSGSGHFRIAFTAPAGVDVTLRARAADAAGGSIAETISRAYRVRS
jgi:hypothetical protein